MSPHGLICVKITRHLNRLAAGTFMYKTAILLAALISGSTALCAEPVVAPAVDGVELRSEGSLYWLQFNKDADALWPVLKNFRFERRHHPEKRKTVTRLYGNRLDKRSTGRTPAFLLC